MCKCAYALQNGKYEDIETKDGELYLITGKSFNKMDILFADGDERIDENMPATAGAILATESLIATKEYFREFKDDDQLGIKYPCNTNYFVYPNSPAKNIKKLILVRYDAANNLFNIVGTDMSICINDWELEDKMDEKRNDYSEFMEMYNFAYQHPLALNIDEEIPVLYNDEAKEKFKDKICGVDDLYKIKCYECKLRDKLVKQYNKTIQIDEELAYYDDYKRKNKINRLYK